MRPDARRFSEESGVDIPGNPARLPHQADNLTQQTLTISVSEALVGGREVLPDVAQCGRAEDRVSDRMEQNVGVGMPFQTLIVRDLDATEEQAASRCKSMSVVADPTPHWLHSRL